MKDERRRWLEAKLEQFERDYLAYSDYGGFELAYFLAVQLCNENKLERPKWLQEAEFALKRTKRGRSNGLISRMHQDLLEFRRWHHAEFWLDRLDQLPRPYRGIEGAFGYVARILSDEASAHNKVGLKPKMVTSTGKTVRRSWKTVGDAIANGKAHRFFAVAGWNGPPPPTKLAEAHARREAVKRRPRHDARCVGCGPSSEEWAAVDAMTVAREALSDQ